MLTTYQRDADRHNWAIPYHTRVAVLERARGRCEACTAQLPLELHHMHYNTVGAETPDDLEALCRDCHHARHVDLWGEFHADPGDVEYVNHMCTKDD